jgi:hypothetical protein
MLKYNIKEDVMGRACSPKGGEKKCIDDIDRKDIRKENSRKTKT